MAAPSSVAAGMTIDPVKVSVYDRTGKLDTTYSGSVRLSLGVHSDVATLDGTLSASAVAGVATFAGLSIKHAALGYTLRAAADGYVPVESLAFSVTPAAAATGAFVVQPADTSAGQLFAPSPKLSVLDAYGNMVVNAAEPITVTLQTMDGETVPGGLIGRTSVTPTQGEALFLNIAPVVAGKRFQLAAKVSGQEVVSQWFNVTADTADHLTFQTKPNSILAGETLNQIQVAVVDQFENPVLDSMFDVSLSVVDAQGQPLSSTATQSSTVKGVATFPALQPSKAGSDYTLRASAPGFIAVVSTPFDILPGAASQIRFDAQPGNIVAGALFSSPVAVRVADSYDNTVLSPALSVTLSVVANAAPLLGTATVNTVSGIATFPDITVSKASGASATYSLTATAGALHANSASFHVNTASATHAVFLTQPNSITAGQTLNALQVTVCDQYENTLPTSGTDVALTLKDAQGQAVGTAVHATTNSTGLATFSALAPKLAGAGFFYEATSGNLPAAASATFDVAAGAASSIAFSTAPSFVQTAGVTFNPPIAVLVSDAYGNPVEGSTSVSLTLLASSGTAPALVGTTVQQTTDGIATFPDLTVTKTTPGTLFATYSIKATSGSYNVTSSSFRVTAGAATHLAFVTQPGSVIAGQTIPTVQTVLRDQYENAVATVGTAVTLTLKSAQGQSMGSPVDATTGTGGVASFASLMPTQVGTGFFYEAASAGVPALASNAFDVTMGAPSSVTFTSQPNDIVAGASFNAPISVMVANQYNVPVSSSSLDVSLTLIASSGTAPTLLGTTSMQTTDGIATFPNLTVTKAPASSSTTYSVKATSGSVSGTSSAFHVTAGSATSLTIAVQPTYQLVGSPLAKTVEVTTADQYGNAVASPANITVMLQDNPTGAALTGTLTRATVNGKASFDDLALDKEGSGYTLSFSAPGASSVVSTAFPVVALNATASFASGSKHACALKPDLSIWCWGENYSGQLGTIAKTITPTATTAAGLWSAVYAGTSVVCAQKPDKTLWCRGANTAGKLGDGTFVNRTDFTQEVTGSTWKTVSIGETHVCGVKADGTLWCWGTGTSGQRGDGTSGATSADSATPIQEQSHSSWLTVAAGVDYTCGVKTDNTLWCWGSNTYGRLGDNTTVSKGVPTQEVSHSLWKAVSAGAKNTCGVKTDGTLWCWGYGWLLGVSNRPDSSVPIQEASLSTWSTASIDEDHVCALRAQGSLWCWGDNGYAQLGTGSQTGVIFSPIQEATSSAWTAVTTGSHGTCGLKADRSIWCWGLRAGDGSYILAPTRESTHSLWGP